MGIMDTAGYEENLKERAGRYRELPRYSTILHDERIKLGLSLTDYCVIDSVHNLSHKPRYPYCITSKDDLAEFLGVSRATIFNSIKTGVEKGFLEKNDRGDLRTTSELSGNLLERFVNLEASRGGKPEWLGDPHEITTLFRTL